MRRPSGDNLLDNKLLFVSLLHKGPGHSYSWYSAFFSPGRVVMSVGGDVMTL